MQRRKALIFGCTGQDGRYLSEILLDKGYIVHGTKRRSSSFNTSRIDHLYQDPHEENRNFILHYCDITDSTNVISVIQKVKPDEIYNLAAQSHVKVSFETPEYTANADALGTLRILEAIRILGLNSKFYQASTSEMFGNAKEFPQNEKTPFYPRSPYGAAKLYAHSITVNYREAYGIFACSGILFNHESPFRGETFVTKKITMGINDVINGGKVFLGNLDAKRDWGHAKDYMNAAYLMMQQNQPDDYVIASGKTTSVRDFAMMAFAEAGIKLKFVGSGINEKAIIEKSEYDIPDGTTAIEIDPHYYRPTDVELLIGDASKARIKLGWSRTYELKDIIREMVKYDLANAEKFKDIRSRA